MYRRLFFLFPSRKQTQQAVQQLQDSGIDTTDIHAFASDAHQLTDLPKATDRQQRGLDVRVEKILWNTDLMVFFSAFVGFAIALFYGALDWAALALTIMTVTFTAGYLFATRLPNVHLSAFKNALSHHEILLSVDVPVQHVARVEQLVHRSHPEAVEGGVGWSLHKFGL